MKYSALLLLAAPGVAHADALQDQVLAGARASRDSDYAFTRRMVIERSGAARTVIVHRFDPRRALAERWTLVSVDGRAPTAKEIAQTRKGAKQPVPHYGEIAKWFGAPATRTASAPGTATYRFAQLPKDTLKLGSHDASPHTGAEAVVNTNGKTPFVSEVRLTSTKAFRMALVASVKTLTFRNHYRLGTDGRPVPQDGAGDIAGSLLGKSGQIRTSVTYSDFVPAR
jgi:hypothetical protein